MDHDVMSDEDWEEEPEGEDIHGHADETMTCSVMHEGG
jgi:hypothetical protein